MGAARAEHVEDSPQGDLFEPAPGSGVFTPKREHVLAPLNDLLADMRAAGVWPWDPVQRNLKRNHVWPYLLGRLPADEAAAWRALLEAEAIRLDAADSA